MKVRNEDLSLETSWRSGVLVFDETPLVQAVAELNRYSSQHLIIDDPGLGAAHVSGVFKTGDVDRFANTVAEILPVAPRARADGAIVLAPRG
jgi:transmembrane sensor